MKINILDLSISLANFVSFSFRHVMFTCRLCGHKIVADRSQVTGHLRSKHDLSVDEYERKYLGQCQNGSEDPSLQTIVEESQFKDDGRNGTAAPSKAEDLSDRVSEKSPDQGQTKCSTDAPGFLNDDKNPDQGTDPAPKTGKSMPVFGVDFYKIGDKRPEVGQPTAPSSSNAESQSPKEDRSATRRSMRSARR